MALSALIAVSGAGARAQSGTESCLERVRAIYRTLAAPGNDSAWSHIHYTVRSEAPPQSAWGANEATVDLVLGKRRMHLITRELELYRDSDYTVAVVPAARTIQLTGVGMNAVADRAMSSLLHLQDSLFGSITESDCRESNGSDGRRRLLVEAIPTPALKSATGMERITFTIDPEGTTLYGIDVAYGDASQVKRFTVAFDIIDLNYSSEELAHPVRAIFFDAAGNLLARYRGYTVTDTRTIKRPPSGETSGSQDGTGLAGSAGASGTGPAK